MSEEVKDKVIESPLSPKEVVEEVKKLEEEEKEGDVTKVTDLATEEKKVPQEKRLTKEDQKDLAMRDYMGGILQLQTSFRKLSKKGMGRLFIAALQLPQEGQKVHLMGKDERALFGIAQRVQAARVSLILHHIEEAVKKQREQIAKQKEEEKSNDGPEQHAASNDDSDGGSGASEPDSGGSSVEQNVEEGK
jgi:hypothetical protein